MHSIIITCMNVSVHKIISFCFLSEFVHCFFILIDSKRLTQFWKLEFSILIRNTTNNIKVYKVGRKNERKGVWIVG